MGATAVRKLSRLHQPPDMSLDAWQRELRRQFGREQSFTLKNHGTGAVFSEFQVTNPRSGSTYRVAIRGPRPGDNYCSCPDFATNALGTCKHVEFVLRKLEGRARTRAMLEHGFQPPYSEVVLQYGAKRDVRFRPGTSCPRTLTALATKYFDAHHLLRAGAYGKFESFLSQAARLNHDLRCYDDALGLVAEVRDRSRRERRIAEVFPRGVRDPELRRLLKVELYEYQREGALFAARAGRCLIGDEMGLGKTVQALAAAEILARHFGVERVLIVCPTSLKHQWEREIARFTDRRALVVGGLRARREQQYAARDGFFAITNYDTVHADLDLIARWSPDLVILDEAQRIKNWNTRTARSVKRIASPYAIVLTGTPLENRLEELVSIVGFVDRHRLGPTFRFLADHQVLDDNGKIVGYRDLDRIGKTLAPVLIRRTKNQVLTQLPERLDKNLFVPMTPQQRVHHEENREVVAKIVAKWRRHKFLSEAEPAPADDRAAEHADELRQHLSAGSPVGFRRQSGRADDVAGRYARAAGLEGRRVQPVGADARVAGQATEEEARRSRAVPRRNRRIAATGARRSLPGGRSLPRVPGDGCGRRRIESAARVDRRQHGHSLESRGPGAAHRSSPSPGAAEPRSSDQLHCRGHHRRGHALGAHIQKSLFAGVLDGGEREVFLGGSRLNRFMEAVEKTTSAIASPPGVRVSGDHGREVKMHVETRPRSGATVTAPTAPAAGDWAALMQTGLAWLDQLAAVSAASRDGRADGLRFVHRDPQTGEDYVRIPVPNPEVLEGALRTIGSLLDRFRR